MTLTGTEFRRFPDLFERHRLRPSLLPLVQHDRPRTIPRPACDLRAPPERAAGSSFGRGRSAGVARTRRQFRHRRHHIFEPPADRPSSGPVKRYPRGGDDPADGAFSPGRSIRDSVIRFPHRRKISSILIRNTVVPIAIRTTLGSYLAIERVKSPKTRSCYEYHSPGRPKTVRTAVGRSIFRADDIGRTSKPATGDGDPADRRTRQGQKKNPAR